MPVVVSVILAIVGATLGSFFQTVADRVGSKRSWIRGRSQCERCNKKLGALELIPIVSFLFLRGKCKHCQRPIAVRHLTSELLLAGLLVGAYWIQPELIPETLWLRLAVVIALFIPFVFDAYYGLLPDSVTVPLILLTLIYLLVTGHSLFTPLLGAVIAGGFFLLQYVVSRGKWVGAGDWRLGIFLGLLVGWPYVLNLLFVTYVGGAIIALILLANRSKKIGDRIPMGMFLIPACLVVLWFGESMLSWLPI